MSAPHTPGPWRAYQDSAGSWNIATRRDGETVEEWLRYSVDCGASICTSIGDHTEARTRGNEEANAQLIATAPDLLEALESIIPRRISLTNRNVPDSLVIPIDTTMGELRQLAAVIAKARGAA